MPGVQALACGQVVPGVAAGLGGVEAERAERRKPRDDGERDQAEPCRRSGACGHRSRWRCRVDPTPRSRAGPSGRCGAPAAATRLRPDARRLGADPRLTGQPAGGSIPARCARALLPVAAIVSLLLVPGLVILAAQAAGTLGFDFLAYHQAASRVLAGERLYDPTVQQTGGFGLFYYPPPFVLAILPFALVPATAATWLWIGASMAMLVAGIAILPVRTIRPVGRRSCSPGCRGRSPTRSSSARSGRCSSSCSRSAGAGSTGRWPSAPPGRSARS